MLLMQVRLIASRLYYYVYRADSTESYEHEIANALIAACWFNFTGIKLTALVSTTKLPRVLIAKLHRRGNTYTKFWRDTIA